jgi:hypothetical protein
MMGYVAKLAPGDLDAEGTIPFVLDAIMELMSIIGLVRNNHFAFIAFSRVAVAAAVVCNGLMDLVFGSVYVSHRVNSEYLAHAIFACIKASKEVGYPITLERCQEDKEEDLHRHVARFWLASLRGGGKGTKGEISSRNLKFIIQEWMNFQFNFCEKSPGHTSLRTLRRETKRYLKHAAKFSKKPARNTPGHTAFWKELTGDESILATLLKFGQLAEFSQWTSEYDDGDDGGDDDDDDDDDLEEPDFASPSRNRDEGPIDEGLSHSDGGGAASGTDEAGPGDNNEDEDPEDPEAVVLGSEVSAAEAARAADNDELLEFEATQEPLTPHSVALTMVKLEMGATSLEAKEEQWSTIELVTRQAGPKSGPEVRIYFKREGAAAMYRVREEQIYSATYSPSSTASGKERLRILLLEPLDCGSLNARTKNWNLAKPLEIDGGPFRLIQKSGTVITLSALPRASSGLRAAWENVVSASWYLQKRARNAKPEVALRARERAPETFEVWRADEARRDKKKTIPFSIPGERPRARLQTEKLLTAFFEHAKYSFFATGARMERKCLGCKRCVYINREGTQHCLVCDRSNHNECFRKVEDWLRAHGEVVPIIPP